MEELWAASRELETKKVRMRTALTFPICLVLASAALSAEELEIEYWKLELPAGHVHVPQRGIDSTVGKITSEKSQLLVTYDVGGSAGLTQREWVENLERTADLQVPAGIGKLFICKPDNEGKRLVKFALPPHFNMSARGPAATVLDDFKALLSRISFRNPFPAEALDSIDARFVDGKKQVKITLTKPKEEPLGPKTPPGSFRLSRACLYESGMFREIGNLAPGQSAEIVVELSKYPSANLVIQGAFTTDTGFRTTIIAISLPELLRRTQDRKR